MKHLQKFNETLEDNIYLEIQKMIDENQFLKGKVNATKETIFETGDFILLLDDLSHITEAHVDESIPGSKFEKGVDLKKAIVEIVSNNSPTEMSKGFGPNETKVQNVDDAEKLKWLSLDSKVLVGQENVHKLDPNSPEFKSMNLYKYKDSRGNEFSIKVKEGEGEKTNFLSFIGAKLGQIGDKTILSIITAFPGKNGAEISNRNDFQKSGYYFTTTNKKVIENSIGQTIESFRHLKTFEAFSMNVDVCPRCGESTNNQTTMSVFNTDTICIPCKNKEREDPDYQLAVDTEAAEVRKGNYNYPGIYPNYKPLD